jgi:YfiH family protein
VLLPPPFYELDGQVAIDIPGARAVFTTRSWGDVRETIGDIGERLEVWPVRPQQVHGDTVLELGVKPGSRTLEVEADAVVTALPGVAPLVITADCLPIVIAAPGAAAAVHAGWRGLAGEVIKLSVEKVRELAPDAALAAAIGPAAGSCCYEVGPELHDRFTGFSAGPNLDLKAIARRQLEAAGVATVHDSGICTICSDPALLFSYRRDGAQTGRQALLTWLT